LIAGGRTANPDPFHVASSTRRRSDRRVRFLRPTGRPTPDSLRPRFPSALFSLGNTMLFSSKATRPDSAPLSLGAHLSLHDGAVRARAARRCSTSVSPPDWSTSPGSDRFGSTMVGRCLRTKGSFSYRSRVGGSRSTAIRVGNGLGSPRFGTRSSTKSCRHGESTVPGVQRQRRV
jgi:hypothetical protein